MGDDANITFNILVVDDDPDIANAIGIYLTTEGYNCTYANDGIQALAEIEKNEPHLIIMDVMMPKLDGIGATLEIRKSKNIPIIMLSAKTEYTDKILGLNMGADDYITKPFNPLELIARVKSTLRRYTILGNVATDKTNETYTIGDLTLDNTNKTVTVYGTEVHLTSIEYKILLLLIKNLGRTFSIDEIYEKVWNEDSISGGSTVTVHIRRIREKIEINPKEPRYIKVVWGIGYKIEKI